MKTCALCGTELNINFCSFCDMELQEKYIMKNGQRLNQYEQFKEFPDKSLMFQSTKELMMLETIDLLCLLREARSFRADVYKLRLLRHKAEEQEGFNEKVVELEKYSYQEYEDATRRVWVIENIIKDRLGYFPKKVTMNFLNMYLERISDSEKKEMIIKK